MPVRPGFESSIFSARDFEILDPSCPSQLGKSRHVPKDRSQLNHESRRYDTTRSKTNRFVDRGSHLETQGTGHPVALVGADLHRTNGTTQSTMTCNQARQAQGTRWVASLLDDDGLRVYRRPRTLDWHSPWRQTPTKTRGRRGRGLRRRAPPSWAGPVGLLLDDGAWPLPTIECEGLGGACQSPMRIRSFKAALVTPFGKPFSQADMRAQSYDSPSQNYHWAS